MISFYLALIWDGNLREDVTVVEDNDLDPIRFIQNPADPQGCIVKIIYDGFFYSILFSSLLVL